LSTVSCLGLVLGIFVFQLIRVPILCYLVLVDNKFLLMNNTLFSSANNMVVVQELQVSDVFNTFSLFVNRVTRFGSN
jgi:hypothetical protein